MEDCQDLSFGKGGSDQYLDYCNPGYIRGIYSKPGWG